MTTSMLVLNAVLAAVYFGAGWLVKHVSAAPAGTSGTGIIGSVLQAIEQQVIADLQSHIGSIVQLPVAQQPAAKS